MADDGVSSPAPARQGFVGASMTLIRRWIALNWLDVLCMLVLGGVSIGIYQSPVPITRTFPITFDHTGDIVYPDWAYPYRGWIIPSWLSGVVSLGGPIAVFVAAQVRVRSFWDMSSAIMGTLWSVLLASLFQVVVKQLIGGFRPYFLEVCMPDLSRAVWNNRTGLNGVGFQRIMYTTEVCTQPDAMKLKTAITSFPSGHSTVAWAGFGFLFLWINAKLKVWADHRPAFWKLTLTLLPLLISVVIACSLTIDAAHNWYDIVGGSVIGIANAFAAYRSSYAAIWDWRFNHVPLQPRDAFVYSVMPGDELKKPTFTRTVGWGVKAEQDGGSGGSARTSAVLVRPQRGEAVVVAAGGLSEREGASGGNKRRVVTAEETV